MTSFWFPRTKSLDRRQPGFSLPEVLVAAALGVLGLSMLLLYQQSMSRQAASGDAQTRAWHTYGRLSAALRHDLLQATRVDAPDPQTLVIEVVEVDDEFRGRPRRVTWRREARDPKTVIREEEGRGRTAFDFSDALGRNEALGLRFTWEP